MNFDVMTIFGVLRTRLFSRSAALSAVLALLAAGPAHALGGSAISGSSWGLSSHVVMVLGSRGSVCTGTLISQRVIVTAAHCTAGSSQIAVAYIEEGRPILQAVSEVARNPGFSRKTAVSLDIALLRLQTDLPNRFVPVPIDRGAAASEVGEDLTIAGFGLSEEHDLKSAGTLRAASVRLLPKLYPRFLRLGIDARLDSLAVCKGDSGGPVMSGGALVGVLYAAERTGKAKVCGATAQAVRLAPQRAWISSVLARW